MRVRATEASRGFSALLNRAADGETVEVVRHGRLIAVISPPQQAMTSGAALIETLRHLTRPDSGFARDVGSLATVTAGPGEPWPS